MSHTEFESFSPNNTVFFKKSKLEPGLYITATPIGNLRDITLRALDVLVSADVVLCEDTRNTQKLLTAYGMKAKLRSYHEHSTDGDRVAILSMLQEQKAIALVSDGGTPLISDPGYKLVRQAQQQGHKTYVVPGASSVTAALSVCGLPTDSFLFLGFLPTQEKACKAKLSALRDYEGSSVILESPKRMLKTLERIKQTLPHAEVALARELTKVFEEVVRCPVDKLIAVLQARPPLKGECVLVVHNADQKAPAGEEGTSLVQQLHAVLQGTQGEKAMQAIVEALKANTPKRELSKWLAPLLNTTPQEVYKRLV